jgi:hypothetical protein
MNLDEIEARANAATPGPWTYHDGCGYVEVPPCGAIEFKPGWERSVHFLARVHNNHVEGEDGLGFDGAFVASARTDVPALVARVRELEAERDHERALLECAPWATYSEGETLLRAQAAEARQLAKQMMDERDKLRAECTALRRELAALMDDH